MSALPYHRMPGPGDLPGDSSHPNSPDYDDSRDVWIDERTTELLDELSASSAVVLDAVEGVNTLAFDGLLDRAVRDFLMDYRRAPDEAAPVAECARELFDRLWPHVEAQLRGDAEGQAEAERDEWEAEQAEMRGGMEDAE